MVLVESNQKLKPGQKAPVFQLCNVDGKIRSSTDYSWANVLVVIFMCNHCPYVLSKIQAIKKLHEQYTLRNVAFVAINSNNHPDYPQDSFENMKKFASENHIKFDYLFDDTQKTAKDYGATCTPDVFVFDADQLLAYHGRIDDARTPEAMPTTHDLVDVLDSLLVGSLPRSAFLPSTGCSIKWRE